MPEERPNILFITCDQFRGDCLGCDGHPVVETPHLDQLAGQGTRFTNAYTAVASCIAARAGILTGMAPRHHGRVGYRDGVLFDYPHTLPGELAKAGYHTQGVGKMHFSPARNLCGFHNVVLHDGYLHCERKARKNYNLVDDYTPWLRARAGEDADLILHGLNANAWVARPWPYSEAVHPTTWATSMAIDFLRRRDPTRPFFLWLSYVRPHPPLDPPEVYFNQYIHQEFPDVPMGNWADKGASMKRVDGGMGYMGARQLHRARAAYYAQITHIDHQIGRLLEYLLEHEVLHNTLIVFTSDHGELLGDHNLFRKALPFQGSVRVPFIVTPPRRWNWPSGIAADPVVELRDVMPTLLEAAGAPCPDTVDGASLLPFCRGERPESWREALHGEHAYGAQSNHYIVTRRYKYAWFSQTGKEYLFDLQADPAECRNLADSPEHAAVLNSLRQRLVEELAGREEGYSDGERLIAGRPARATLSFLDRDQGAAG